MLTGLLPPCMLAMPLRWFQLHIPLPVWGHVPIASGRCGWAAGISGLAMYQLLKPHPGAHPTVITAMKLRLSLRTLVPTTYRCSRRSQPLGIPVHCIAAFSSKHNIWHNVFHLQ
jgi:hypothetical protein